MNTVYLLMGGNLGDVRTTFLDAQKEIEKNVGKISKASSLYKTAAWGIEEQNDFLNQALKVYTELSVQDVLKNILQIEEKLGRIRNEKLGPRKIDIDILLFNEEIIEEENLTVPHPFLHKRNFAMAPLASIAALAFHPILKKNIETLLKESEDKLKVTELKNE